METLDVRMARMEERMVMVVGEQRALKTEVSSGFVSMGEKLDGLSKQHWQLSGKHIGMNASVSLIVSAITVVVIYLASKP